MENVDSERKQKLKKVAKLGVKCAWLVSWICLFGIIFLKMDKIK